MLKELMPKVVRDGIDVEEMVMKTGYTKIEDERYIESVAREVFRENPKAVRDAIENPKAINFLIGAIMKKTSGRADPQKTREIVMRLLEEYK